MQRITKQSLKKLPEKTKEEALAWLIEAGIIVPGKRELLGEERDKVLTMLALVEPVVESNNQHSWSEDYIVGNKHYCVHYFPDEEVPIVEEIEIE